MSLIEDGRKINLQNKQKNTYTLLNTIYDKSLDHRLDIEKVTPSCLFIYEKNNDILISIINSCFDLLNNKEYIKIQYKAGYNFYLSCGNKVNQDQEYLFNWDDYIRYLGRIVSDFTCRSCNKNINNPGFCSYKCRVNYLFLD